MTRMQQQHGFSVIELMVGLCVGLLLVVMVFEIASSSNQNYRANDAQAYLQNNGRFATDYLERAIRRAGYFGCIGDPTLITNQLNTGAAGYNAALHNYTTPIQGSANSSGAGGIVTGTDTITVQGAQNVATSLPLLAPFGTSASTLTVAANNGFIQGDLALVSNCQGGDIFQITSGTPSATGQLTHTSAGVNAPGNLSNSFSQTYQAGSYVYAMFSDTYSIQTGADGNPALFKTGLNGTQELVPGIENLKILFGEDTDNDNVANQYVKANAVTNMNNVVSVRVSVVAISQDNNQTVAPKSYVLEGATITPTDKRLRRVYTSTITIRNRYKA